MCWVPVGKHDRYNRKEMKGKRKRNTKKKEIGKRGKEGKKGRKEKESREGEEREEKERHKEKSYLQKVGDILGAAVEGHSISSIQKTYGGKKMMYEKEKEKRGNTFGSGR